jgi:hypothetical protein
MKPVTMKDYYEGGDCVLTDKMCRLPPSNKKEFVLKVGEDYYRGDTGLNYDVTMRTIARLKAKEELHKQLYYKQLEDDMIK